MLCRVRLAVLVICVFLSIIYSCSTDSTAGELLSKIEVLPNSTTHHIFTNGNVNANSYPIFYYFENHDIQDNVASKGKDAGRSYADGKNPAYVRMMQANPNDEKYAKLIDKLLDVSSGSPSVGRKTEIDAINKALRALAPMTSYGRGSANTATWRQQDEIEEQKSATQRMKLDAESERDRAKRNADDAKRDAQQARREADQAKNEAQWEADRIRTDNIINNRW